MAGDAAPAGAGRAADGGPALAIGLFCPAWPPGRHANGIITYVGAVAEGMARLGHRPYILAGMVDGPAAGDSPAPVIDLGPLADPGRAGRLLGRLAPRLGLRRSASPAARIGRALRRALRGAGGCPRLDLLEIEETFGLPGAIAGRTPVPVVARLHGPWFLNGPNQGGDPSSPGFARRVREEGLGIAAAAGVTAPSRDVLERTRACYGMALEGAEAIPNATATVPEGRRWRPEGCEAGRILFVGRFDRHKGGDTIVDAFALLHRDRPSARLTIVGPDRGLERDGRRWDLRAYVEHRLPGALGDGRVEWLGPRPGGELEALRRRAAVTVAASRYETFAITISEAMAVGCPLVATRAGGASEVFEHGEHGLYAEPDDPAGLASAIGSLLADPGRAAALGRAAAAHCARHYAPEAVASRTIAFYRRALGPPRRPALAEESRP